MIRLEGVVWRCGGRLHHFSRCYIGTLLGYCSTTKMLGKDLWHRCGGRQRWFRLRSLVAKFTGQPTSGYLLNNSSPAGTSSAAASAGAPGCSILVTAMTFLLLLPNTKTLVAETFCSGLPAGPPWQAGTKTAHGSHCVRYAQVSQLQHSSAVTAFFQLIFCFAVIQQTSSRSERKLS